MWAGKELERRRKRAEDKRRKRGGEQERGETSLPNEENMFTHIFVSQAWIHSSFPSFLPLHFFKKFFFFYWQRRSEPVMSQREGPIGWNPKAEQKRPFCVEFVRSPPACRGFPQTCRLGYLVTLISLWASLWFRVVVQPRETVIRLNLRLFARTAMFIFYTICKKIFIWIQSGHLISIQLDETMWKALPSTKYLRLEMGDRDENNQNHYF